MSLDDKELKEIERQAAELAWNVGGILLDHFQKGSLHVEYKGKQQGDDPVTEADHRAETFLKDELARRFPDHAIVGEEGAGEGTGAAPLTWVVDPLDGTTNFLNGLPFFASSLGLVEDGVPVVAALFVPWPTGARGRVFHARSGGGAWEDGRALSVAQYDSPVPGRMVVLPTFRTGPFRAKDGLARTPGERRSVGSTAYELALVADGRYQYAVFGAPKSWDVAAGILLVQEAQGRVVTRERRGGDWRAFTSFASDKEEGPPGQSTLRKWAGVILAGSPEMTEFVSRQLYLINPAVRRTKAWVGSQASRVGQAARSLLPRD